MRGLALAIALALPSTDAFASLDEADQLMGGGIGSVFAPIDKATDAFDNCEGFSDDFMENKGWDAGKSCSGALWDRDSCPGNNKYVAKFYELYGEGTGGLTRYDGYTLNPEFMKSYAKSGLVKYCHETQEEGSDEACGKHGIGTWTFCKKGQICVKHGDFGEHSECHDLMNTELTCGPGKPMCTQEGYYTSKCWDRKEGGCVERGAGGMEDYQWFQHGFRCGYNKEFYFQRQDRIGGFPKISSDDGKDRTKDDWMEACNLCLLSMLDNCLVCPLNPKLGCRQEENVPFGEKKSVYLGGTGTRPGTHSCNRGDNLETAADQDLTSIPITAAPMILMAVIAPYAAPFVASAVMSGASAFGTAYIYTSLTAVVGVFTFGVTTKFGDGGPESASEGKLKEALEARKNSLGLAVTDPIGARCPVPNCWTVCGEKSGVCVAGGDWNNTNICGAGGLCCKPGDSSPCPADMPMRDYHTCVPNETINELSYVGPPEPPPPPPPPPLPPPSPPPNSCTKASDCASEMCFRDDKKGGDFCWSKHPRGTCCRWDWNKNNVWSCAFCANGNEWSLPGGQGEGANVVRYTMQYCGSSRVCS